MGSDGGVAPVSFDAVVLAGGEGRRLGGRSKAELVVAQRRLIDVVLDACAAAASTIVVGPEVATVRDVIWTREQPPGGGPCAAVAAGVAHVTSPVTVLLAVDLPHLTAELVGRLAAAAPVVGVDDAGREQWLLSAWPSDALHGLPGEGALGRALGGLRYATVPVGAAAGDIDTPEDLRRVMSAAELPSSGSRATRRDD
ncbi:MAG TPA: NTP transferase domain-containing protein [Mycobacteriales bacterium]|nr:NTP transferase domain-containing protein [Mycobacteriales bacterium]